MKSILNLDLKCNEETLEAIIAKRKSLERVTLNDFNYYFNRKNKNLFTKEVFAILENKRSELVQEIKKGFDVQSLPILIENAIKNFKTQFEEERLSFYGNYTSNDDFSVFKSGSITYRPLSQNKGCIMSYKDLTFNLNIDENDTLIAQSSRYQSHDSLGEILIKSNMEEIFGLFDHQMIVEHIKIMKLLISSKAYIKRKDKNSYDYFMENFRDKPLSFEPRKFKDKLLELKEIGMLYDYNINSPKIKEYLK